MRIWLLAAAGVMLLVPLVRAQENPTKAANPAKAIIAEYAAAQKDYFAAMRAAKTPEERAEAAKKAPNPSAVAQRLLKIAKGSPKSEAAGDAVIWISTVASRSPEAKSAISILIENHATHPGVTAAMLDRLSFTPHPQMDKFLERVSKEGSSDAAKEAAASIRKFLVGKVVPDIAAEDTDGKTFKLSDYRGKVVMLDFWGHW